MVHKALALVVIGVVAGSVSLSAHADLKWDFSSSTSSSANSITATATGWSDTGGAATYNVSTATLESAYVGVYTGGLGITNADGTSATSSPGCNTATQDCGEATGTAPEHAVDNQGRYDSLLFNFGKNVQLTGIQIGWTQTDADISLLACDPTKGCNPTLSGKKYSDLVVAGWTLVGSYANLTTTGGGSSTSTPDIRKVNGGNPNNVGFDKTSNGSDVTNAANTSAQYWLVTAFNPTLSGTLSGFDSGNDYFKVQAIYGVANGNKVPEPGSLALLGALAAGAFTMKRFRKKVRLTAN